MKLTHAFIIVALTAVLNHPVIAAGPSEECLAALWEEANLFENINLRGQAMTGLRKQIAEVENQLTSARNDFRDLCIITKDDLVRDEPPLRRARWSSRDCNHKREKFEELRLKLINLFELFKIENAIFIKDSQKWEDLQETIIKECPDSDSSVAVQNREGIALSCGNSAARIIGSWNWFGGTTTTVTLKDDGTAVAKHNPDGKEMNWAAWRCEGSKIVIEWKQKGNNFIDTLELTDGGRKLEGNNNLGSPVWGVKKFGVKK